MTSSTVLLLLAAFLAVASASRFTDLSSINSASSKIDETSGEEDLSKHHKKHHRFRSPEGLFIQERASKQLPGPGQHYFFGALGGEAGWEKIHNIVNGSPNTKLVLMIRHGQAISNWLETELGPDDWFNVEEKCEYVDDNETSWGVFDAELTDLGVEQAVSLNNMLVGSKWFERLVNGSDTRLIVSPLSRCLRTATIVFKDIKIPNISVEENIRETLGEDTCDARRSVSDPNPEKPELLQGPCAFDNGLRSKWPQFKFPIVDEGLRAKARNGEGYAEGEPGFGLISDRDLMWTDTREKQKHQVRRATNFLEDLFNFAPEKVVFVLTHSGFTRSLLLAVGREPYRPQNTELVPVIITKNVDSEGL